MCLLAVPWFLLLRGVVFEVGCSLPVASLGDSGVFGSVGVLA